jgi:hypothetical protein
MNPISLFYTNNFIIQDVTEKYGQTLVMSSKYRNKKKYLHQHASRNISIVKYSWKNIATTYSIAGDCLVGLLMVNPYQDFLLYDLLILLGDVSLQVRAQMWYMHHGALAHFSRAV